MDKQPQPKPPTAAMLRELSAIAKTGEPTDPYDWIGAAALWFHARDRVLSALLRRGLIEATDSGFVLTDAGRLVLRGHNAPATAATGPQ
jgi:hypothetical protein